VAKRADYFCGEEFKELEHLNRARYRFQNKKKAAPLETAFLI
jgi:hypothetical protein